MQYVSDIFTMLSRTASTYICGSGSGVEHHLAKVRVAGSNLVFRSTAVLTDCFFIAAEVRSRSISSSAPQQSRSRLLFVIGLPYCYKTDIYHVNIAHLAAKIHIRFFGFPS